MEAKFLLSLVVQQECKLDDLSAKREIAPVFHVTDAAKIVTATSIASCLFQIEALLMGGLAGVVDRGCS
eukprot:scaffold260653_cov27-Prasinocladus_malaysianus.AAC.2